RPGGRAGPHDDDRHAPAAAAAQRVSDERQPPAPEPRPVRLFVALDLPAAARDALLAFAADAADPAVWRPVAPEALHVTLAFLGSRPPGDVAAIERVLAAEAGGPAPRLALGGALLLPP